MVSSSELSCICNKSAAISSQRSHGAWFLPLSVEPSGAGGPGCLGAAFPLPAHLDLLRLCQPDLPQPLQLHHGHVAADPTSAWPALNPRPSPCRGIADRWRDKVCPLYLLRLQRRLST